MKDTSPKRHTLLSPWPWTLAAAVALAFLLVLWYDRLPTEPAPPDPATPESSTDRSSPPPDHPPLAEAGGLMGTPQGMLGIRYDRDDPEEVWSNSCAKCHGLDGRPTKAALPMGTPDLQDKEIRARLTPEGIEQVIREGAGGMPHYGHKLPDETIRALVRKVMDL